ncbi:hypothetical protein MES5069_490012 [Mesorhizobium escarrei]|uniref:Uncharacterized protein n=1 Tax=Mesorhizobium escarrei TaxID=666018 RepID=A0ABN8K831_9HYPH|nr:hypothetical protein MES5069_490012 [Mesorhizobium escarrei]
MAKRRSGQSPAPLARFLSSPASPGAPQSEGKQEASAPRLWDSQLEFQLLIGYFEVLSTSERGSGSLPAAYT